MSGGQLAWRWRTDRRGNVAMIFGLMLPVIIFAIGMVIDYGMHARTQARLQAIADEAALAAVSSAAMAQTDSQAQALAQGIFIGQAAQFSQVTIPAGQPTVAISYPTSPIIRQATITFSGTYGTIFSGIIGYPTLPVGGTSVAQSASSTAPNINFYVLADNSGSMALPATSAGVAKMQSLTPAQLTGGCAFACHEASPNTAPPGWAIDTQGNPCQPGTSGSNCPVIDNYQVARNNGITLRFDELTQAVNDLITAAASLQSAMNPAPTYQFGVYSVDAPYQQGMYTVMSPTTNFASGWSSASSNLQLYTVYSDGQACDLATMTSCAPGQAISPNGSAPYQNVGFLNTTFADKLQWFQSNIPQAGSGASGAAPQEVLFIVTDGVEDTVAGNAITIAPFDATSLAACAALQNNGVKIAILYTTYYPTPGFWLYDNYVAGFQSSIASNLQSCASPGLFMTAGLDDNISNDLLQLFQIVIQSSRLTQ